MREPRRPDLVATDGVVNVGADPTGYLPREPGRARSFMSGPVGAPDGARSHGTGMALRVSPGRCQRPGCLAAFIPKAASCGHDAGYGEHLVPTACDGGRRQD
jgi:hypothetical protein